MGCIRLKQYSRVKSRCSLRPDPVITYIRYTWGGGYGACMQSETIPSYNVLLSMRASATGRGRAKDGARARARAKVLSRLAS